MPTSQKHKISDSKSGQYLNAWGILFAVVLSILTLGLFALLRLILGSWLLPKSAFTIEPEHTVGSPVAPVVPTSLKVNPATCVHNLVGMRGNSINLAAMNDPRIQTLLVKYYHKDMPLLGSPEKYGNIKRSIHGASHVARVWVLANILDANICHDLGVDLIDDLAKMIDPGSPDDVKSLIRWLPIMHDCGRQQAGPDCWDHLSGELLTYELISQNMPPVWAYMLGCYMACKDNPYFAYYRITGDKAYVSDHEIHMLDRNQKSFPHSNQFQALSRSMSNQATDLLTSQNGKVHKLLSYLSGLTAAADSLDIQRLYQNFNSDYIATFASIQGLVHGDAFKDSFLENAQSLADFAKAMIDESGDKCGAKNYATKVAYEHDSDILKKMTDLACRMSSPSKAGKAA